MMERLERRIVEEEGRIVAIYYLIKSMVRLEPAERITWSILEHSLKIMREQIEL